MQLNDFIAQHRATARKPGADIRERWQKRIVARHLHQQGRAGAVAYLRDYGKGISVAKLIALALQSEAEGCDDMAIGFWLSACKAETGVEAAADETTSSTPQPKPKPTDTAFNHLPSHLRPESIITMQPIDAPHPREHYINSDAYIGQPKRDGSRIVVIATGRCVAYQGRSMECIASPGAPFDAAFTFTARRMGDFVLDGELLFIDAAGGEHRTGSQAAKANALADKPAALVICRIAVFKALFLNGDDLTQAQEWERVLKALPLVEMALAHLEQNHVRDYDIEPLRSAHITPAKRSLVAVQQAEGREGEVWIHTNAKYLPGKSGGDIFVRTKYVDETEVVVTGLTPTTVAGRPFGSIEVSDDNGRALGRVGTGFDAAEARQIAAAFKTKKPTRMLVRHQGRTEAGQLWHARFLKLLTPD